MTKFLFSPVKTDTLTRINNKRTLTKNGFHDKIIYMGNERVEAEFKAHVQAGDIIEFHADGLPWVVGRTVFDPQTDQNPYTLAAYFDAMIEDKDLPLTLDLRICCSGVRVSGPHGELCFAEDLSKALAEYGFRNITVYGYTGYILSPKTELRQSLSSDAHKNRARGVEHCPLEEGRVEFTNGIETRSATKTLLTEKYTLKDYKKDRTLRNYLATKNNILFEKEIQRLGCLTALLDDSSEEDLRGQENITPVSDDGELPNIVPLLAEFGTPTFRDRDMRPVQVIWAAQGHELDEVRTDDSEPITPTVRL